MQALYDKGIFTGWALVVEMIERGDTHDIYKLADILKGMYQGKLTARDQLVLDHASVMHKTLNAAKNMEKGCWSAVDTMKLLELFDREVEEFKAALWGYMGFHGVELQHVASEAADVSNFAAMIVDNCKRVNHDNKEASNAI